MWDVLVGLKVLDVEGVGDCGLTEGNSDRFWIGEEIVVLTMALSEANGLNLCECVLPPEASRDGGRRSLRLDALDLFESLDCG